MRAGFTLIEVMIALAIVGGLLVTLIYTLNYHLDIAGRHETKTIACLLAKDKIMETGDKIRSKTLTGNNKGEFPEPYSDYHYEVFVGDSNYHGILEVSVVVSRGREQVKLSELIRYLE